MRRGALTVGPYIETPMSLQVTPSAPLNVSNLVIGIGPAVIALLGIIVGGTLGGQWSGRLRRVLKDDLAILKTLRECGLPTADTEARIRRELTALYAEPLDLVAPIRPFRVYLPYLLIASPFVIAGVVLTLDGDRWGVSTTVANILYVVGYAIIFSGMRPYLRAGRKHTRWLLSGIIKSARDLPPDYELPPL
jgi:hypothetical protein